MHLPSPVRLLGIDLGITSDHTAVVIDDAGSICARRRARSTVASLATLEAAALASAAGQLGDTLTGLRFLAWDAAEPATGWRLQIAIEDPAAGRAWAVTAVDAA